MIVYLARYRSWWVSPYWIIEFCLQLVYGPDYELDYDSPFAQKWNKHLRPLCQRIADFGNWLLPSRAKYIRIGFDDVVNLNDTLASIIAPSLRAYKERARYLSFWVDKDDVPEHLHGLCYDDDLNVIEITDPVEDQGYNLLWNHHILDEMIWAFENLKVDFNSKEKRLLERELNGYRLFGKYFRKLWL